MSIPPPPPSDYDLQEEPEKPKRPTGWLGSLGALGLLLWKAKGLLAAVKFLPLLKSGLWMFVYMGVTAWQIGWPAAVMILAVLLLHETGHAIALKIQGRPVYALTFIPFVGAFGRQEPGKHVTQDAFVALAGPLMALPTIVLFGACFAIWPSSIWVVGILFALIINLFALAPAPFFDGGKVVAMLSPKLWALGLVIVMVIAWRNPIFWLIAIMSLPAIIAGWKVDVEKEPYYKVTTAQGTGYTLVYLALALILFGLNSGLQAVLIQK